MEKKYFYGQELTTKEVQEGYVSFRTLAKTANMVLCNNIGKLELEPIANQSTYDYDGIANDLGLDYDYISNLFDDDLEELLNENDLYLSDYEQYEDIFQYYIVDDYKLFQDAECPIFYNDLLDVYIVGITHYGTSWDCVNTCFKIN